MRPAQEFVLLLRRSGHDLELCHRARTLPERGANAVRTGVAAADHHDALALCRDRLRIPKGLAGDAAVLLRQESHGLLDALQLAAGNGQLARLFSTAAEE